MDIKGHSEKGFEIQCDQLSLSVNVGKGKRKVHADKPILQTITASFKPGRLTAIMGASGAGKTSLLSVLVIAISVLLTLLGRRCSP